MSEILTIESLTKVYETESERLSVLDGLNLQAQEGEKIIITGKSGCGKSTFLNIVAGIDSATSGSVRVAGFDVSGAKEKEAAKFRQNFLGLVFQFHYLLKDFTALENVVLPMLIAGKPRNFAEERAKSLLEAVSLESRATHLPSQLSGGERQRVAVARALANDPALILADEPTGNLDKANAEAIFSLLFSVSEKYGKTLILVTHDVSAQNLGDSHYSLQDGKLARNAE